MTDYQIGVAELAGISTQEIKKVAIEEFLKSIEKELLKKYVFTPRSISSLSHECHSTGVVD